MIEPFDKKFAEALRQADQPVSLDACELTERLVRLRVVKSKQRARRTLVVGTLTGLVGAALLSSWLIQWPENRGEQQAKILHQAKVEQTDSELPKSVDRDLTQSAEPIAENTLVSRIADEIMLFQAEKEYRVLKQQVGLLRRRQSQQDWVLRREMTSRTMINRTAITPYEL